MTEKSDHPLKESLSALVDGEASELELRRILKSGDEESRETWRRYQLASALMRKDCNAPLESQSASAFSAGVLAAIDAEDAGASSVPHASAGERRDNVVALNPWMGGLAKVAVAASVTFAMLLGVNNFRGQDAPATDIEQFAVETPAVERPGDTSAHVPEGYSVPSLSAMTVASPVKGPVRNTSNLRYSPVPANDAFQYSPELQEQLQRMLTLHSDQAASEVGLTLVPSSRLSAQDIPKE